MASGPHRDTVSWCLVHGAFPGAQPSWAELLGVHLAEWTLEVERGQETPRWREQVQGQVSDKTGVEERPGVVEGLAAGFLSVGQGLTFLWDTGKGVCQAALGAG